MAEAHSEEVFVFGENDLVEFVRAHDISSVIHGENPAAFAGIPDGTNPVGVPGKISPAHGKTNGQYFTGPLLKDLVRFVRGDVVDHLDMMERLYVRSPPVWSVPPVGRRGACTKLARAPG